MEQYTAVRLVTKHGTRLALAAGAALPLLALLGLLVAGWHWVWLPVAAVAGVAVWFLFRLIAELTRIICEMLLPQ